MALTPQDVSRIANLARLELSPAEQAGFQASDVILSVNDQAINGNLSAYVDAWQTGGSA